MEWGIDDVEIFVTQNNVLIHHTGLHSLHIVIVHFAADDLDQIFVGFPFHVLHAHFVHLVDDTFVVRLEHL